MTPLGPRIKKKPHPDKINQKKTAELIKKKPYPEKVGHGTSKRMVFYSFARPEVKNIKVFGGPDSQTCENTYVLTRRSEKWPLSARASKKKRTPTKLIKKTQK